VNNTLLAQVLLDGNSNNTLLALVLSERREQLSIAELLALCMMEMLRGIRYLHPS